MEWIRFRAWLGVLAGVVALGGCGGDGGTGGGGGGTVVVGMRSDFSGLNPVTNSSLDTDQILKYGLYTPLIQYDDDLNPAPYLAESWELHGDTAVTFTLREDVRWHDGEPVTAEDVKFTFDLAKTPETGSLIGSAYLGSVESAEVLDPRTIRFTFTEPHAQALEDFWWAPVPQHLLEETDPAGMANAPFNRQPVGSGPFRFGEWRSNDRLVLVRNDSFPEGLGGPPAADRIVFRVIPEPATLLTELITGGVHVDIPLEPDQTPRVEGTDNLRLHSYPGNTLFYLGWNNQRAPFDQAEVRRAMTMGIDRQEIIDALLSGYGRPATSTIPPWHPLDPGVDPLAYDPEVAQQLLESAGWTDQDGDGVRERNGQRLEFSILTSERPLNRAIVEVLQEQLRGIGAAARVEVLEFQTMLSQHRNRDFDAVLSNWVLDNFQMASAPYALFHSSQAEVEQSANRSGVRNAELDALIEAGAAATDPEEARATWREFTELLHQEQPFTFMFWLDELAASSEAVSGVEMDQRGEFRTMAEWSVR
ncbi:MAG TPA: ABC transporter substrate-binding protein [Longimicrobiales bacterium]|nr:ABC transporter substrate-binding protein [Longimicrobiales bacterium]